MKTIAINTLLARIANSSNYRIENGCIYELSAGKSAFLYAAKLKDGVGQYSARAIEYAALALKDGERMATQHERRL